MDRHSYGTNRWKIICGTLSGPEGNAVRELYAGISAEVGYVPVSEFAENCVDFKDNLFVVGTPVHNRLIGELLGDDTPAEGSFRVRVFSSPFADGRQVVVLAGGSEQDTLYAVSYLLNIYFTRARQNTQHYPYFVKLLERELPECDISLRPNFAERGIWTWGHCIHDYVRFARNMAMLGLNSITIWNDFAPINMKDVVDCFHSYGIKVIFGFSFGWEEEIDISLESDMRYWVDKTVQRYEQEYLGLGGDGIYFQSFTETSDEEINGVPIARTVVKWVNALGSAMLEKWPDLYLCFGLHATSIRNRLDDISQVDSRISIHWEDCGAFPYDYLSRRTESFDEALNFTDHFAALRDGKYGVVLKGQVCLDWSMFENQKGPFILGCESKKTIQARLPELTQRWHDIQSYWIKNIGCFRETLRHLPNAAVYSLIEDGLLEEACWYPAVLFAYSLWDDNIPDSELMQIAAAAPITVMA